MNTPNKSIANDFMVASEMHVSKPPILVFCFVPLSPNHAPLLCPICVKMIRFSAALGGRKGGWRGG